jgi:uncharacterized Fe-S cluster protein YjdI
MDPPDAPDDVTDAASPARMEEGVARSYRTAHVVVTWAPHLCIHAGECFRTSPAVFDPGARPWVRPEAATPEEVEETVRRCPSGALGFRWLETGDTASPQD